jgi:hypothetical protein
MSASHSERDAGLNSQTALMKIRPASLQLAALGTEDDLSVWQQFVTRRQRRRS